MVRRLASFSLALAVAFLVACGGGGGSRSSQIPPTNPPAPQTCTATAPPVAATSSATVGPSSATLHVGYGQTNGSPAPLLVSSASNSNGYTGGGNLEPCDSGATLAGGGQGPSGSGTVDGISCQPSMSGLYHVHAFVGVFFDGHEVAVPAGVGMVNPNPPNQYSVNGEPTSAPTSGAIPNQTLTADCYYDLHIHDDSGMLHIETAEAGQCGAATYFPATPAPGASLQPCNKTSPFTLKTFLDVWGISLSPSNFGPLAGSVQIYATPPGYNSYTACGNDSSGDVITPCTTSSSVYRLYYPLAGISDPMQAASQIGLASHTTIWVVVGTPLPAGLPSIAWDEGNP